MRIQYNSCLSILSLFLFRGIAMHIRCNSCLRILSFKVGITLYTNLYKHVIQTRCIHLSITLEIVNALICDFLLVQFKSIHLFHQIKYTITIRTDAFDRYIFVGEGEHRSNVSLYNALSMYKGKMKKFKSSQKLTN